MMDLVLEAWVSSIIEAKKLRWMLGGGQAWKPGEKLKLLFAGYNGTRNTGSDVRVEEMLRQIRQFLVQIALPSPSCRKISNSHATTSKAQLRFTCPISFHHFFRARFPGITASWPVKAPCSRASSPMPSPR